MLDFVFQLIGHLSLAVDLLIGIVWWLTTPL